jgi:hypothetical protein
MLSDGDVTMAVAIAVVVLLLIVAFWLRLRSRDIAGYWASSAGALYEVRPTGSRSFALQAAADDLAGVTGPVVGHLSGLRSVTLSGGRKGHVELGGRRISWRGGDWMKQGV